MGISREKSITPIFILGLARSGTTLLQSLLDGHPQLLVDVADGRFFGRYFKKSRGKNFAKRISLADRYLISHIFNPSSLYYQEFLSHIAIQNLRSHFRKLVQVSKKRPKDFWESYIFAMGLASGTLTDETLYWVDKTPSNEFFLKKIIRWWPNAMYIHIFRDPRDLYSSYKARAIKNFRGVTRIEALAFAWNKSVKALKIFGGIIGSNRYFVLRYEDLVEEPEKIMSQVRDFLCIQENSILHRPTKGHGKVAWGGNAVSGYKTYQVTKAAAGKWKTSLSDSELRKIESLFYEGMDSLGYQASNNRESLKRYQMSRLINHFRGLKFRISNFSI